jgi:hypothetical protein
MQLTFAIGVSSYRWVFPARSAFGGAERALGVSPAWIAAWVVLMTVVVGCDRTPAAAPPAPANASAAAGSGKGGIAAPGGPTIGAPPPQVAAAIAVVKANLGRELKAAMANGGPANAIDVCNHRAPRIVAEVQRPGLAIGRTSHRLRNPANAPPAWAADFVRDAAEMRLDKVPAQVHFDLGGGRHGYLEMIGTAGLCMGCHGPSASLDVSLKAKLAVLYPNDAATGFAQGSLRGWFIAEVDGSAFGTDTGGRGEQ